MILVQKCVWIWVEHLVISYILLVTWTNINTDDLVIERSFLYGLNICILDLRYVFLQ